MLDLDKNGKISKDELKTVLGHHDDFKDKDEKYWELMIKDADKNGDGEVAQFQQLLFFLCTV